MGKTVLVIFKSIAIFAFILFLMIFVGVNWNSKIILSLVFGPEVEVRMVILMLIAFGCGIILNSILVAYYLSQGKKSEKIRQAQHKLKEEKIQAKKQAREEKRQNKQARRQQRKSKKRSLPWQDK